MLLGFGAGALLGTMTGGRFGDRRPFGTAIPAAVLTACVLAATALWASNVPAAVTLVVLLGPTAFVLTPILVAQALYAASDAPTLVSALATSAFNIGNAGGSWLGGLALSTSLGLRGPALTGLVLTLASMAPLTLLAAVRPSAPSVPPTLSPNPETGETTTASRHPEMPAQRSRSRTDGQHNRSRRLRPWPVRPRKTGTHGQVSGPRPARGSGAVDHGLPTDGHEQYGGEAPHAWGQAGPPPRQNRAMQVAILGPLEVHDDGGAPVAVEGKVLLIRAEDGPARRIELVSCIGLSSDARTEISARRRARHPHRPGAVRCGTGWPPVRRSQGTALPRSRTRSGSWRGSPRRSWPGASPSRRAHGGSS